MDWDFVLCRTQSGIGAVMTSGKVRVAATQTEAPQATSNAALPALGFADSDPPISVGLGSLSYKISTANPQAQKYFDQGLRLTYAFNHAEARVPSARRRGSTPIARCAPGARRWSWART